MRIRIDDSDVAHTSASPQGMVALCGARPKFRWRYVRSSIDHPSCPVCDEILARNAKEKPPSQGGKGA